MQGGDVFEALVGDLYLSAVDAGAASRLPSRFAALTGGRTASMWRFDRRSTAPTGRLLTNAPAEALAAYAGHYHSQDPWAEAVHGARFGRVVHGAEIVDEAKLARSAYYNEFGAEYGLFHALGVLVPLGPGHGDRVGVVSILRPRADGAFDVPAASALEKVLPHLRNAFHLHEQVEGRMDALRSEALDGALEALGVPAAALGGDGAIVRFNPLIEPLIRHVLPRGRTASALAGTPDAGKRLERLVATAAAGAAGGQAWLPHPTRPILATVAPLPDALARLDASGRARVLLILRAAGHDDVGRAAGLAMSAFGLTRAEAHAAACLAGGQSPGDIADAKRVKVSTVRTLLGRAQDKVGARNLRDLVRVLAMLG